MEELSKFKRQYLFTRISNSVLKYIEMLGIKNGRTEQIQIAITFYSDFWLSPVIYWDAWNSNQNLHANSNDNNFLIECPIESRNISVAQN